MIEEVPKQVEEIAKNLNKNQARNKGSSTIQKMQPGSWEALDKRKVTSENELEIEGHKINLVNIERELWPGINKADLIQYYISVADYILPQLKDRPLGLNICLNSAAAGGFFIRGMEGRAPKWAKIFTTDRRHKMKGKSERLNGWFAMTKQPLFI